MNLNEITVLKGRIAKIAAVLCVLSLLSALEGSVAFLREPFNTFRLVPGSDEKLTGPMAPNVTDIAGMTSESTSDSVSLSLDETLSGFWMGGRMWRGTLSVTPNARPGKYVVSVFGIADQKKVGSNVFQIVVYPDRAAILSDSKSYILRYSGFSPWGIAAFLFFLVLLACGSLYIISGKRDRILADRGEAEVFHITKDAVGVSIYFGLGSRDGVKKGSRLALMDPDGMPVAEITVESVSESDGLAIMGPQSEVRPGYLVRKIQS